MKTEKIGRVSSASVKKGSGKDWDQWIKILDNAGAVNWTHQEIVKFLKQKYKLDVWWQQGVTLGFELAKGKRIEGQSLKGTYLAMATRTFPVSARKVWNFLKSEEGQSIWLQPLSPIQLKAGEDFEAEGGVFGQVRTVKAGVRARLTWTETEWPKSTVLQIYVASRSPKKCILIFSHEGIRDTRVRAQLRERWKKAVDDLLERCKTI